MTETYQVFSWFGVTRPRECTLCGLNFGKAKRVNIRGHVAGYERTMFVWEEILPKGFYWVCADCIPKAFDGTF